MTLAARHPLLATAVVALGPASTLGMSRFAYGLALPAMKADLALSYAQSGWLNTANAAGYLIGALPAARVIGALGARPTLLLGMLLTAVAITASGLTRSFELISLLRLIAGITGALTFVAGGSIASQIAVWPGVRQSLAIGLYLGGVGFGILLSGLFTPAILALDPWGPRQPWQLAWLAIGLTSVAMTAVAFRFAPDEHAAAARGETRPARWPIASFAPALVAYLLYGAAYIGYMTFIVAYVADHGYGVLAVSTFWSLLGLASVVCPWVWARPIDRLRGGRALALLLGILLVANALPLLSTHPIVILASAALFGLSFTAVVASVIAIHRRNLPSEAMPSAISLLTVAFAAGQIAGPVASGAIADLMGGLAWSLVFSVVTLASAIAVAPFQRDLGGAAGR